MHMGTKNEIYEQFVKEYRNAGKERKGEILNSLAETTKTARKSVIRRLREFLRPGGKPAPQKRGRKSVYNADVLAALKEVWTIGGEVCGALLYGVIEEYVAILQRDGDWEHSDEATRKLLQMSEATVRRRVAALRVKYGLRGVGTTSPSKIKTIVPVYAGSWRSQKPGSGQIDTVVHCGHILMGDMAYTLTFVDVIIGWVVLAAQWNKGEAATVKSVEHIEVVLPWHVLWLHSDSGGEFIQWDLVTWTKERKIRFTRCRRGKSNDNAYVEERNGHVVRKWIGHWRFDCPEAVDALNAYYAVLTLYLNHFVAIRKTKTKTRVGGAYQRTRDEAQTPYARALAHPDIPEEVKERLRTEHAGLSPLHLSKELEKLKGALFAIQTRHGNPKFKS